MLGAQVPAGPSLPPATLMEDKLLSFFFPLQDTRFGWERLCGVVRMLLKVGFDCSLLWSQYLRGKVGEKENLLYIRGWQPGERAVSKGGWYPNNNRWAETFKGEYQGCVGAGRGLQAETAQSALTVILKGVSFSHHCEAEFTKHWIVHPAMVWSTFSWLFGVQLIFSSRVDWFPFLRGHFLELWQPMSWLQSGHRGVNFFHLAWVSQHL